MEFEASNVPSNSNMAISDDLIIKILSRLSVKSLLKFRSVSKFWLSFISNPQFIKKHQNLSANFHVLLRDCLKEKMIYKECPVISLFDDSVTEALELDHPLHLLKNDRHWIYVQGSCNGLVYLSCYDCFEHSFLWNPTTRKHKKLPSFGRTGKQPFETTFGFGYDELQDDYKVVNISNYMAVNFSDYFYFGKPDFEVKVYSLKTNSWTKVDFCDEETCSIDRIPHYRRDTACFVAGKLHWGTSPGYGCRANIIAFDLSCEKWEKVENPSYGEEETRELVVKLGSDLSVFTSVFTDYKRTHVVVWVMKEYGVKESWIKMFTITCPNDEWFPFFSVSYKGEILCMSWATFMVYNSKDDSFRYLHITNCHDGNLAACYLESLVSPFPAQRTDNMEKAICPSSQLLFQCTCEGSS